MVLKNKRKIRSKTARMMLTWSHYRFRMFLHHKAREFVSCKVTECTEEYSSKTCGNCRSINKKLGGSKIFRCDSCSLEIDRDMNGARNILLKRITEGQGVKESRHGNFLGCRPIINGIAQPYVWQTYFEVQQRIANFGSGRTLLDMKEALPTLKTLIISDDADQDLIDYANELNIQIVNFETIENDGAIHQAEEINPKPDDIATICYTSSTTGMPKCVVLTHKNFMSIVCSLIFLGSQRKMTKITKDDVHISDILKLLDDITELKPTIFISVPRLLNRIYDKVLASISGKGSMTQWTFTTAYNAKKVGLSKGQVDHRMWDKLVFVPIRLKLGGRIKVILSAFAPISPDVMDFLRIYFSADVYEGYGQTEML
ncbi:35692_t:CDS:2, partial [Racocetra persica]